MLQYLGVYQFAFMLDFDDFFNPLLPDHKDLHYYVEEFYRDRPKLTTAYVKWLNYCESPDLSRFPQNGNITATIKDYTKTSKISSRAKALHRIDGVLYVGIHNSFNLVKGFHSSWTDTNLAYAAHLDLETIARGTSTICNCHFFYHSNIEIYKTLIVAIPTQTVRTFCSWFTGSQPTLKGSLIDLK